MYGPGRRMYWVSVFPSAGCHKGHYSHDGAAEDVVVVASATRVVPERDSSLSQTAAIQAFLVVFLPHLRYR